MRDLRVPRDLQRRRRPKDLRLHADHLRRRGQDLRHDPGRLRRAGPGLRDLRRHHPVCSAAHTCVACSDANPCPGQCCADDGSCRPGTTVAFCGPVGGACAACGAGQICAAGACADPPCGEGGPCLVFVTSSTHDGNLGGLAGADEICNDLAAAAGLDGAYLAWLSDTTGSPSTRFHRSTGPYRRVDGVTVAESWADLTTAKPGGSYLAAAILVTEAGGEAPPGHVDTNTRPDGSPASGDDCNDWTAGGDAGVSKRTGFVRSDVTSDSWTDGGRHSCGLAARLYCFQQPEP